MRKIALLFLLSLAGLQAQPLTKHERDFAMSHLHATRKLFLDSIAGLSEAQWRFKPAPDAWSIAEVAEHITVSEEAIFDRITKQMLAGPAAPEKKAEVAGKDEKVIQAVVSRQQKFQAPEFLKPSNRWKTPEEMIRHFKARRDQSIAFIDKTQDELRTRLANHPALGTLDAYQWFLLLSAHTERHTNQIKEVKANPKFPKK